MTRWIRKSLGAVVGCVLPPRWIRTLRNPALLHSYYRDIAGDIEPILDLQRSPEWMDDDYWAAMLRKYAHIIDKGLWACSFEKGHGQNYRDAAVEAYENIRSESVRNDPSVQWAVQKIEQYDQAQISGIACHGSISQEFPASTYDDLAATISSRRSNRSFLTKPVDDQTLRKITAVAPWAPSSCNKQAIKIFVTNNSELAKECLATCKGGTCFSDYIPCFISFCADLRSYSMPEEAWLPQIDIGLAAQNSCLAAHTLGLSLCLLTWCQHTAQEEDELRRLLGLPRHHRIVLNGVVGFPASSVDTPVRKSIEHLLVLRK